MMEKILMELITNYGIDGFMAAALVYTVIRFDRRLAERDRRDEEQRHELIDIIKNNTSAMASLQTIIRNLRN